MDFQLGSILVSGTPVFSIESPCLLLFSSFPLLSEIAQQKKLSRGSLLEWADFWLIARARMEHSRTHTFLPTRTQHSHTCTPPRTQRINHYYRHSFIFDSLLLAGWIGWDTLYSPLKQPARPKKNPTWKIQIPQSSNTVSSNHRYSARLFLVVPHADAPKMQYCRFFFLHSLRGQNRSSPRRSEILDVFLLIPLFSHDDGRDFCWCGRFGLSRLRVGERELLNSN